MLKVAVLVSGGGSNLQALIDAKQAGNIKNGELALVLSSSADAYALERAKNAGVPTRVCSKKEYRTREEFTDAILGILKEYKIDLVVLAGFMYILSPKFCEEYENRVMNVHPALIPSFCGDGFYGLKVHEKVIASGVKITGATVHFVNSITDGGPIISQGAVPVRFDDTPEILQKRVMAECEWKLLPQAVDLFCQGKLRVVGSRVEILE